MYIIFWEFTSWRPNAMTSIFSDIFCITDFCEYYAKVVDMPQSLYSAVEWIHNFHENAFP